MKTREHSSHALTLCEPKLERLKTQEKHELSGIECRPYTEEELENIAGLCELLQSIHSRLISEGRSIDELRKEAMAHLEKTC